jgi:hypothetical protein
VQIHKEDLPKGYELVSREQVEMTLEAGVEQQDVNFAVRLSAPIQQF